MSTMSSPIFHGMMAAVGAAKYDTENGCIDAWNGWCNGIPIEPFDLTERGYDNFYLELSKYSEKLASYYNNIFKLNNGQGPDDLYDGCFSLEVSQKFGEWFAQFVKEHGCAPEATVAEVALHEIFDEYMSHPAVTFQIKPDDKDNK